MDIKNSVKTLMELSNLFGPAGFEDDVRSYIIDKVKETGYEYKTDKRGNLIVYKKGEGEYTVILDAHMDEVGFMVKYISERGFIKVVPIGGYDERILPGHIITFKTKNGFVEGIFSTLPPHVLSPEERQKPLKLKDLWVDVGADSKKEVLSLGINQGTPGVIYYPARTINGKVMGKAFDDRVGCAVLLYLIETLKDVSLPYNVLFVFATQEEVGLRGAQVVKEYYNPDLVLVFEGTLATDIEGVAEKDRITQMGKGPALTLMDKSVIPSRKLLTFIESIAEKYNIPYQYKMPGVGGTDGGAYAIKNTEVAIIATPVRNIHSPTSLLSTSDFESTLNLATKVLLNLKEYFKG